MPETNPQPPFFHGIEPRMWTPNRFYRVYVLPSELIFIRAGSAGELTAAVGAQFGLLGGLIAAAANPAKKNQKRQEELDRSGLDELIGDHKHNFRVRIDEIDAATLDPSSLWLAAVYSQPNHVGVLRFKHPSRGGMRLAIGSTEEMKKAFEALPAVFGERLAANVEWSEKKNRFVRKK